MSKRAARRFDTCHEPPRSLCTGFYRCGKMIWARRHACLTRQHRVAHSWGRQARMQGSTGFPLIFFKIQQEALRKQAALLCPLRGLVHCVAGLVAAALGYPLGGAVHCTLQEEKGRWEGRCRRTRWVRQSSRRAALGGEGIEQSVCARRSGTSKFPARVARW